MTNKDETTMITRRDMIETAGAFALLAGFGSKADAAVSPMLPEGARLEAALDALPGKKPLIKLSYRPPNYETPIEYFRSIITSNDAFFVRYHLPVIPRVDSRRTGRALPMFGQSSRSVPTACTGGRMGLWRNGLRALDGRAA